MGKKQIIRCYTLFLILSGAFFPARGCFATLQHLQTLPEGEFYTRMDKSLDENTSVYFSLTVYVALSWNTSVPIPIHLRYAITILRTTGGVASFRAILYVDFRDLTDSPNSSFLRLNKTIFTLSFDVNQHLDGRSFPSWNLTSDLTGISSNQIWEGNAHMLAEISIGDYIESNTSNHLAVTYKYTSLHSGGLSIPPNVLFGGALLGVIAIIIFIQIKRRKY